MKNKKMIWIVLAVVVLAAAGYFFWSQRNAKNAEAAYQTVVAGNGDISAIVGATGTVRPNQSVQLFWQTNGTVEAVLVKVGDQVKKDAVLAELDKASLSQSIILAEADLLSAQRSLEDMQTSTLAKAQAEQAVVQAQDAFDDAEKKLQGVNFQRASDTKIENTQSNLDLIDQQISQARKYYAVFAKLPDGDSRKAAALSNLTSLELQRDQIVAELNYITGKPDEIEVSQRQATYDVAFAQLEDARLKLERLADGPDPVDLARAQAQITAAEATLKMAYVTAPFSGTIMMSEPLPGDQASPGLLAFRLDDLSHLLVDVQISEIDINAIEVGQTVTLSFDAILGKTYTGKIIEVGQVGSAVQGAVEFTVTVELLDADDQVKSGMTAAVTILTREIKDVLVVPNRAVRVVDGKRVVYILKDGMPEMVSIRLGASDEVYSEVIGGDLQQGDLIVLNPPTSFSGGGGPMGGGRPGGN